MQSTLKSKLENSFLKESNDAFYLDSTTADVNFLFFPKDGEKHSAPAHKILLATKSRAFFAMFYGEKKVKGDIKIINASSSAFKEFLQFFYLQNVTLTIENIYEVMHLIRSHHVNECFPICDEFLFHHDDRQLCIEIAIVFDRCELMNRYVRESHEFTSYFLAANAFFKSSKKVLTSILESGQLKCSAMNTFGGCLKCAELMCVDNRLDPSNLKHCKQQLQDCFHLIPFNEMNVEEIQKCYEKYKALFDQKDLINLINLICL